MTSLPVRKSRTFSFTPSKPHKHQRIREYILYCCPTGRFKQQLEDFWSKTRDLCGSNGFHNYSIPHITLVSFFKAQEDSTKLVDAVKSLASDGKYLNIPMQLELYKSNNFMGFFVKEDDANVLKRIALKFVKEISDLIVSDHIDLDNLIACFPYCASAVNEQSSSSNFRCIPKSSRSISLEPHVKNLHLTLAYQYPPEVYHELSDLVQSIDFSSATNWVLRLYSRDPRLATKQVHRVVCPHPSRDADELELKIGDYVYVSNDANHSSVDGWAEAICATTGNYGFVPLNHTERTSETNVWSLNANVTLCESSENDDTDVVDGISYASEKDNLTENRFSRSEKMDEPTSCVRKRKRVVILRHGERVDFVFGSPWTNFSFSDSGDYVRMDLNMPECLPPRTSEDWEKDGPLTTLGEVQSQLVGSSLKNFGVNFSKVFASPAYRCLQTANSVLTAMGLQHELPMKVEYGMFEWLGWYEDGFPNWLSEKELGVIFNVDQEYQPVLGRNYLEENPKESLESFYERNSTTMKEVMNNCDGDILVVAHATNLETCTRQLIKKEPRTPADLRNLLMKVPYLAAVAMEQMDESTFQLIEPPCLTLTHNSCTKFDWRFVDDH